MTREELEKRLESAEKQMIGLQDEIENLKGKLAEMENSGDIPEFPVFEREELYFSMNEELKIKHGFHSGYKGMNHEEEDDLYNAFHTKEIAQEFADKCKLIAMMLHCKRHLCPDYTPDFTDIGTKKWHVYYAISSGRYDRDYNYHHVLNTVYFDTEANAKKCADWLNERMKKDD